MKLQQLIQTGHDEILEIMNVDQSHSVFEDYGDFKFLLIRRIEFNQQQLEFRTEAFILKTKEIYYYNRDSDDFVELKDTYKELAERLEAYFKNNQNMIQAYANQIAELEDYLFERRIPGVFMDIWFDIKKDLSRLENYYYRSAIVYHEFYRKTESQFGSYKDEFKDVEDSIQFHLSSLTSLKSRLDGLHHYHDSIKKDRTGKTLFMLTVLSGIFLPLNLIVGFFGMNTGGMYFKDDPAATTEVLLILATVLFISVLGIPVIHLIDRYILRIILGRYDFYKNISNKIDELGVRFRGR